MVMQDKGIQKMSANPLLAGIESNTETLSRYENPSFAEYTTVERDTTWSLSIYNALGSVAYFVHRDSIASVHSSNKYNSRSEMDIVSMEVGVNSVLQYRIRLE